MNKRLTKPFTKNVRLDSPNGLLGVPPDMPAAFTLPADKVILIVDRPTALRFLSESQGKGPLPS